MWYPQRKKKKLRIPWRLIWLVLPVLVLIYVFTPWKVSINSEPMVFPVVEGVQKTYEIEAQINVNKPGFVTLALVKDTGTVVEISKEVVFAVSSRKVIIPFEVSEPAPLNLEVRFLKTTATVEAARGVSLDGVYVLAGYNKGQVSLFQKPPDYPTFKVLGTATAEGEYLPLTLLENLGLSLHQEGGQISWPLDSNIQLKATSSPSLVTLSSTKYPDLSLSLPLQGSLYIGGQGLVKGEDVVLILPKKVAQNLGASTYPQVSLVLGRGYFTVQEVPTTAFSYIDRFATYLLDLAVFKNDKRAKEVYQQVNALKLAVEEQSASFADAWLEDRRETESFLEQFSMEGGNCSLKSPIPNPVVASGFGERMHPLLQTKVFHTGIDILAIPGYPLKAPADGVVVYRGYRPQWGYFTVLNHSGCSTVYAHLLMLPQLDSYKEGDVFAYTGASGFVTGPHLHFEVRIGGKPVDPRGYIGVK